MNDKAAWAKRIVAHVMDELQSRKGFDALLDELDPEIYQEIVDELEHVIRRDHLQDEDFVYDG